MVMSVKILTLFTSHVSKVWILQYISFSDSEPEISTSAAHTYTKPFSLIPIYILYSWFVQRGLFFLCSSTCEQNKTRIVNLLLLPLLSTFSSCRCIRCWRQVQKVKHSLFVKCSQIWHLLYCVLLTLLLWESGESVMNFWAHWKIYYVCLTVNNL